MDKTTHLWIRNKSDEAAAAEGCRFDPEAGLHAVWWIERYCRLYEGEQAGEPLVLHGCKDCLHEIAIPDTWEEAKPLYLERAARHAACFKSGHDLDWQFECVIRLFGWVRHSSKWNREIRRFRKASIWVPKKSKKSPTLCAIALYLLIGDGEHGQKVYMAAKDGKQIRENVGRHLVAMLRQCPELYDADDPSLSACEINGSTKQITHKPSSSIITLLSSGSSRSKQSKEGLNGSVLIDETHVVDRDLVEIIDKAGISRAEPLHLEVSTAGDNPDSYGKERFDYALSVEKGEFKDQELFVAIYACPQDLSDRDLAEDPMKWIKMANPALRHTIDPEEILHDYKVSRVTARKLSRFKMYRLNIWQRTSTAWIRGSDWDSCYQEFSPEDLKGEVCWGGLDLAKTQDTTSFQLVFPRGDGEYWLLSYFWLPREKAEAMDANVSYLAWEQSEFITLTEGNVCDYSVVIQDILDLAEQFQIQGFAFDPYAAEYVTQQIEEETGIQRQAFRQVFLSFGSPTKDFERLVLSKKLRHNGNKCMSWQVGHCRVQTDAAGNIKPCKPTDAKDYRKIDGPVAAIMALAMAEQDENRGGGSAYSLPDDQRILFI